jgi:putative pyruvate formate lyase activating enzyme
MPAVNEIPGQNPLGRLRDCHLCPRACHADRTGHEPGYCRSGAGYGVSSICAHHGEEPVISGRSGIANIFFSHCNLQCVYCQNYQISRNRTVEEQMTLDGIAGQLEAILDAGATLVGFVSPSHCIPQMLSIIAELKRRGRHAKFVYNTNGYDKPETLRELEGIIDIYLPDLKYMDARLAAEFSEAPDYPEMATKALREMHRQKGSRVMLNDDGVIESGLIIRHLVLPGNAENSKRCQQFIAEELSPSVYLSLMSQYHPTPAVANHPVLGRRLFRREYEEVLEEMERLGFHNGWTQALASPDCYNPDFANEKPFKSP